MLIAVLPVKDLRHVKQRLAGLLSADERRALCLAMLSDVLGALRSARRLPAVLVYSPDEDVLSLAADFGVQVERERASTGQSGAVAGAIPHCLDRGATSLLTIPVDTPLLTGEDVDSLIAYWQGLSLPPPSAVLVPSRDGTGTNALLLTPPGALPPSFGPDSLARHLQEARERSVACRQFCLPRLALDVDSPDDLAAFLDEAERSPFSFKALAYLRQSGLADRCRAAVR